VCISQVLDKLISENCSRLWETRKLKSDPIRRSLFIIMNLGLMSHCAMLIQTSSSRFKLTNAMYYVESLLLTKITNKRLRREWKSILPSNNDKPNEWSRDHKYLLFIKYCTETMFNTFHEIEWKLKTHFNLPSIMMRESFESVMDDITQVSVPLICCETHRMVLLPKLVHDYVVICKWFKPCLKMCSWVFLVFIASFNLF